MTDPPRLARLPVARVRAAPLAVLAQRDAIRVVALALVRLVVAPLAVLAGEGHSDAHVSAGHVAAPGEVVRSAGGPGQRNDPPRASRHSILAQRRRLRRASATRPPLRARRRTPAATSATP